MNTEKVILHFCGEDVNNYLELGIESSFVPRVGETLDLSSEGLSKVEEVCGIHYKCYEGKMVCIGVSLKGR
jgi:hypothetical protein